MAIKPKKRHPKYRTKIDDRQKKKLSDIKSKVNFRKLLSDIYNLPFDIKCKIFQIAMLTHIAGWCRELRPKFGYVKQEFFKGGKGIGYLDNGGNPKFFTHATYKSHTGKINEWKSLDFSNIQDNLPCYKNVITNEQQNIISVYIHPSKVIPNLIKYREWDNLPNIFWTHISCRCYRCDLIRVTGDRVTRVPKDMNRILKNYRPHKYTRITMDPDKVAPWKISPSKCK